MKTILTLSNHTILYDKDCPLCNLYTNTFIQSKMLDEKGRKPFEEITDEECNYIDVKRAVNEIALVDKKDKKVYYGIDSLLKVIGNSYPIVERIGNVQPINFCLRNLYSFVSYNRKVIIPSEKKEAEVKACIPEFNITYRMLYLLFSIVMVGYVLFRFTGLIESFPKTNLKRELILAGGQIVFQLLFLLKKDFKTTVNYLGNLMSVSLLGCIGLVQLIFLNSFIALPQIFIFASFFGIVAMMFFEHKRRVNLLELPKYLTYTWVLYRVLALVIILNV